MNVLGIFVRKIVSLCEKAKYSFQSLQNNPNNSFISVRSGLPVRINNPDDFLYDNFIDGVSGLKLLRVFSMPLKVGTNSLCCEYQSTAVDAVIILLLSHFYHVIITLLLTAECSITD